MQRWGPTQVDSVPAGERLSPQSAAEYTAPERGASKGSLLRARTASVVPILPATQASRHCRSELDQLLKSQPLQRASRDGQDLGQALAAAGRATSIYTQIVCTIRKPELLYVRSAMNRRLNITLPEQTVRMLDRAVPQGQRSHLLDETVRRFTNEQGKTNLREQLELARISHQGGWT